MEKTLELRFRNHENRLVTIRVPNPRADLTATEVATAMDDLMTYGVFAGNASTITTKESARVVSRDVEAIQI